MSATISWTIAAAGAVAAVVLVATAKAPGAQCGDGLFPVGHRCCPSVSGDGEVCGASRSCPAPLVLEDGVCVAPDVKVLVPETRVTVGPSDWEADGVVRSRDIHVAPFAIDAFEITERRIHPEKPPEDGARAAGGLTRAEVSAVCASRGGRLPTEDEWVAAAATAKATRYPWGDTGAVCRRAAWGLVDGPCAHGARGPDTVGAHATGDGPLGIHDLAGNVAEWVSGDRGMVLGGSYEAQLAADLRVWSRQVVDPETRRPAIGGRCAYDRSE
jgi:formylglycine-generating enzyme required for sulfatase activity